VRPNAVKKIAYAALATVLVMVLWRALHHTDAPAEDDSLAVNRVWVEKRPDKLTDYVHVMLLFSRGHLGIFQRSSSYDIRMEMADFTRDKATIKLVFPQSGAKKEFRVKVSKCSVLPPFDLCLDVDSNPWGGPKRYYGFLDEQDERNALGGLAADARAVASRAEGSERP
jgi:hypothetical protein